jgi:hypothetical protein
MFINECVGETGESYYCSLISFLIVLYSCGEVLMLELCKERQRHEKLTVLSSLIPVVIDGSVPKQKAERKAGLAVDGEVYVICKYSMRLGWECGGQRQGLS